MTEGTGKTARLALRTGMAALLVLAGGAARAEPDAGRQIRAQAAGALAVLGMATVPNEAASTLSFSAGGESGGAGFRGSQFGGGFNPGDGPLYVESFLGWNSYRPGRLFPGQDGSDATWQSAALTAGLGWDFPIGHGMVFRPILDLALGNITVGQPGDGPLEDVASFLGDGVTAAGLGGALMVEGDWSLGPDRDLNASLRHSRMWLQATGSDSSRLGTAEAITSSAWARLRLPTPWSALRRPLRAVGEVALASYAGDQAEVLDTNWLAQVGLGAEIDLAAAKLPRVTAARVMLRYTRGDHADGVSLGFSLDF